MNNPWIKLVFIILVGVPIAIANGYALSILWRWFIAPAFSLPEISIPVAMGIYIIASMLTHQKTKDESNSGEELIEALLMAILKPFMALFFGFIYLQFI